MLDRISIAIEAVAAVLLAAITVLVVASAIGRYLLAMPIPDAFDLSRYLLGAAIFWGFASIGYRGSHIKVDLFAEMMGPRLRRVVDIFAWLVLLLFTVLLAWKMLDRVRSAAASGEATFDLRLPAWPMMALIWAGVAVSVIAIIARLAILLRAGGSLESFEAIDTGPTKDGSDERL
jgi:C4-dicarboxylate transporter DctQ subunit